jgi:DNA polymerase III subunit delta'
MIPPRANPELAGHEDALRALLDLYRGGRLPHAILLAGPRGIGKATLAFRFARFVLSGTSAERADTSPESGVFRRVAAATHADLLTIERTLDPRRGRLKSEIGVAEAREAAQFLRLSAAEEGWRVVVIDGAEEMTRNAQNALLKILEEPPSRALLVLVSHNPGRLLPTIRSRCRNVLLAPLSPPLVARLIAGAEPQIEAEEREALALLSEGSIGRALDLWAAGGLELYRSLLGLLSGVPKLDLGALHAFADRLVRPGAEDGLRVAGELLLELVARVAVAAAGGRQEPEILAGEGRVLSALAARGEASRWVLVRERIEQGFARARDLNLDKKQAILAAFFAIEEGAR